MNDITGQTPGRSDPVFDGLSLAQLAQIAEQCGVDGPVDGMVAFARRIRAAALAVDGLPVLMTVLRGD